MYYYNSFNYFYNRVFECYSPSLIRNAIGYDSFAYPINDV